MAGCDIDESALQFEFCDRNMDLETCPICWRAFSPTVVPICLVCGHSCCSDCLASIRSCSLCRHKIGPSFPRKPNYSLMAIIDKLEHFLLELGKGFLFEARQKRFTFDDNHFYVDLVFYNRLLRCYVVIDLKIGSLTHQDLGQMQMYVNYFDRHIKTADEAPTVGILLCYDKNDALVELTLPANSNIYAAQYQLYLPSKEALREKMQEAEAAWEAAQ